MNRLRTYQKKKLAVLQARGSHRSSFPAALLVIAKPDITSAELRVGKALIVIDFEGKRVLR